MRKLVIAITLLMICAVSCTSFNDAPDFPTVENKSTRYISSKEAYDIAVRCYHDFGFDKNSRSNRPASVFLYDTSIRQGRGSEQDSSFYIVNFIDGGFAVVAAQRNNPNPIFGIAEKGTFSADDNPNLQYYMELGKEYYANFPTGPWRPWQEIDSAFTLELDSTVTYTNRYVPTKWGQWHPYNYYCPKKTYGNGNCPTGCLPLAMAQIMAFHQFPSSYIFNDNKLDLYWQEILICNNLDDLEYSSIYGVEQTQRLLRNLGTLVHAVYTDSMTTAFPSDAIPVFHELGFDASKLIFGPTFEQCLTSIKEYGPILIAGGIHFDDIISHNEHAWVVDAAKIKKSYIKKDDGNKGPLLGTHYYFHMNWGVSGKGDGFFLVPEKFNPSISSQQKDIVDHVRVILDINPAP